MEQWLIDGLTATISGVLTVFSVLILISLVISLLKYVDRISIKVKGLKFKKPKIEMKEEIIFTGHLKADSIEKEDQQPEDMLEIVAIITAVLSSEMNVSIDSLQVRAIRRVNSGGRQWYRR